MFFRDSPSNTTTSLPSSTGTTAAPITTNGTSSSRDQDDDGSSPRVAISHKDKNTTNTSSAKEVEGYVGFAVLPNQIYRKAVKKGFEFTLMVVGESGLGKSTLINSMFLSDIYSNEYPGPSLRQKKTLQVETTKVLLKENGVNLQLTIVDTPGFGDAVDNSNCWQPVTDYIETQYEDFLNCESRVNRRSMPDNRVHSCIYFIAPSGHGLKPLDIEFMKRLQDKVNIIPVIAKADTMTPEECAQFKKTILNEITQNKIKVYEFPDSDEDEESKNQKPLKDRVPFAVVGSNVLIDSNGKKVRGRRYPWGIAEVENLEHCDFIALRNMLVRTHMQDLIDITNNVHYENYRYRRLAGVGNDGKPLRVSNKNPLAQMEEERHEHENKMKKMEQDMEQVFEMKVKEKKQKLKDSEIDLQRRHEQMKKNLDQQQKDMDDKRKAFEKEKSNWEEANKVSLEDLRRRSLENNSKEKSPKSFTEITRKSSFVKLRRTDAIVKKMCPHSSDSALDMTTNNDNLAQNQCHMQVDGKEKKKEKKKGLF
ncbi:Septin-7, variant 2 [Chamberlinius hualienensis]